MALLLNLEWLNHNENRAYPLSVDASRLDATGTFQLPNDFITSIYLSVHAGLDVDPGNFLIYQIGVFSVGYSILIGYDNGTAIVPVASAMIAKAHHTENQYYRLGGMGDFVDATGQIAIGKLEQIDDQPAGLFTFDIAGGRIEPDAIRPILRGMGALRVQNGLDISEPIYGDVVLRAGRNMRISVSQVSGEDPEIRFDAIEGEGLNESCVCEESSDEPIRTINGIGPTPNGDFIFRVNDCIQVEVLENGVRLVDTCSKPCCGCAELEVVTTALESLGAQARTIESFVSSLEARVAQMDQAVLGSRLGDRGCTSQ